MAKKFSNKFLADMAKTTENPKVQHKLVDMGVDEFDDNLLVYNITTHHSVIDRIADRRMAPEYAAFRPTDIIWHRNTLDSTVRKFLTHPSSVARAQARERLEKGPQQEFPLYHETRVDNLLSRVLNG